MDDPKEDHEICLSVYRVMHGTNIKHGEEITWYSPEEAKPGTIKTRINYFQGVPHGVYEEYYPNGRLKTRTEFRGGQQVSYPEMWDESGNRM